LSIAVKARTPSIDVLPKLKTIANLESAISNLTWRLNKMNRREEEVAPKTNTETTKTTIKRK